MIGSASHIEDSLYLHLRAWRESRGLTLAALAEAIGSKASTLSEWESGARTADLADLARLAALYDVHPAALLSAPDDDQGAAEVQALAAAVAESDADPRTAPHAEVRAWLMRLAEGELDAPPPEPR